MPTIPPALVPLIASAIHAVRRCFGLPLCSKVQDPPNLMESSPAAPIAGTLPL